MLAPQLVHYSWEDNDFRRAKTAVSIVSAARPHAIASPSPCAAFATSSEPLKVVGLTICSPRTQVTVYGPEIEASAL